MVVKNKDNLKKLISELDKKLQKINSHLKTLKSIRFPYVLDDKTKLLFKINQEKIQELIIKRDKLDNKRRLARLILKNIVQECKAITAILNEKV